MDDSHHAETGTKRREFLIRMSGIAFAAPVISSFTLDGVISPDVSRAQTFGNQFCGNQSGGPDLAITVSANPSTATSGEPLTYTITVISSGGFPTSNVVVTDILDPSVQFVSMSTTQGTATRSGTPSPKSKGGTISWNVGTLTECSGTGPTATLTIVVTPTKPGTITNTASATADFVIHDPDDSATLTTTVLGH